MNIDFLNNSQKHIRRLDFGTQLGLGFVLKMFDNFSAGINYGQSDFSKFKTNTNVGINDKQKLKIQLELFND